MKNTLIATMVISFCLAGSAFAEEGHGKMDSAKHIQMHEKMAEAHKNAAECLKSGKSEDVCRAEMMKAMQSIKKDCGCKDHGCSMAGHGDCAKGKCKHEHADSK